MPFYNYPSFQSPQINTAPSQGFEMVRKPTSDMGNGILSDKLILNDFGVKKSFSTGMDAGENASNPWEAYITGAEKSFNMNVDKINSPEQVLQHNPASGAIAGGIGGLMGFRNSVLGGAL